jgi:hypothetical protein
MSATGFIRQAIQPVPRFMVSLHARGPRPAAFRRAVLEAVNLIAKPLTYPPSLNALRHCSSSGWAAAYRRCETGVE